MMPTEMSRSLHQGLEQCDTATMLSLYDDDAELRIIDHDHSPSRPRMVKGKASLERYFDDLLGRPMTHHVEEEVMSDNHYAFTDSCQYPDGSRVYSSAMAILKDGKIVHETDVQEWDQEE